MVSLPIVGGDNETWGTELNAWLLVAHNPDGTALTTSTTSGVTAYGETSTDWAFSTTDGSTVLTGTAGSTQYNLSFVAPAAYVYITYTACCHADTTSVSGGVGFTTSYSIRREDVGPTVIQAPFAAGTTIFVNAAAPFLNASVTRRNTVALIPGVTYTLRTQARGIGAVTTQQDIFFRSLLVQS